MIKSTKDCKISTELVPKCPVCGGKMEVNLRIDANFVQDDNWYKQNRKYGEFLENSKNKNLVLLELCILEKRNYKKYYTNRKKCVKIDMAFKKTN